MKQQNKEKQYQRQLNKKYHNILAQEQLWARSVSGSIIKHRQISVWEVLIPVLLVFYYFRTKGGRDVFVKNLLFTKELALKAASRMERDSIPRQEAINTIEEKTRKLLTPENECVYSEEVRSRQLDEIDILIEHYLKLFRNDEEEYKGMVLSAYGSEDNYNLFLERLDNMEKEVNAAALKTLGERGDPELVRRMEETSERVRKNISGDIFEGMR